MAKRQKNETPADDREPARTTPESERGPDRMGSPGRTPGMAEGEDGEPRELPAGEPGKTPGTAEG